MKKKLLSVVVPAYREKRIDRDLLAIAEILENELGAEYTFEIICVVDGMVDETWKKAKSVGDERIKVFGYGENRGKGFAVRFGMEKTKGDLVATMDAGGELHPNGLVMGLEHMAWYDADIIVGSKRHPVSKVNYPFERRLTSVGYQLLVRILFGLNVRDTQVGLKLFKRKVVRAILPKLTVDTYAFDIEVLALANELGFKRIFESPVEIHYSFTSLTHASTLKSILRMFLDTLSVFWRLRILKPYMKKKI